MVVLICISLIVSGVEHLFVCFWPSVYLLWRNVYLDLSPHFMIGLLGVFYELHELFVYFGE